MSVEWKQGAGPQAVDSPFASNDIAPGRIHDAKLTSDLLSPHLYDLVVWGFTERNALDIPRLQPVKRPALVRVLLGVPRLCARRSWCG